MKEVIYLHKKYQKILTFILSIILTLSIYLGSYIQSYLKYNNKELIETESIVSENNILKSELENISPYLDNDKIARVIYRNPISFYEEMTIYGENIKENDAVVSIEGLVGVVSKVEENKAYVNLVNSIPISVKINEYYGILNDNKIELISKYAKINEGDKVYTSGIGYLAPDIYIGKITKVSTDNDNLGIIATIETCSLESLNYVYLLSGVSS